MAAVAASGAKSTVIDQQAFIINQSSGAAHTHGVVAVVTDADRWLVIRRSASVRAPGKICFPGGGLESGESEQDAIVREMQEELRVAVAPVSRLWASLTPWDVHLAWWHVDLLSAPQAIDPNLAEVAECFWLTPDEIGELPDLLPSNLAFLAAWRCGVFQLP